MIRQEHYSKLQELRKNNPEIHNIFCETANDYYKDLGIASHEIKNMISFINSSYQFISMQHPEAKDYKFFNEMGDAINELIYFMERTSVYRYSTTYNPSVVNISDLLYQLPDEADISHPDTERDFYFDTPANDIEITGDYNQLLSAFNEIISNCYEATKEDDTIYISAASDDSGQNIIITISNDGTLPNIELAQLGSSQKLSHECIDANILCKPFYTTKEKHIGVGLSIANNVCMTHNGKLSFEQSDNKTTVHISLPVNNGN